ncbi:conserved protein of unknown function [Shewanella benthica]|uniref:Uncharacterized protein n=1 Tax=Shewanella benthica TaxID=43661 RepID=A0A330LX55_9GAMM|nr:hypothetical protein [Shewanella benthica]SQH74592.1 conserved protein of unknown function [Shewanella benthica]
MPSKEYSEGLLASSYSDNPYESDSNQFDEFERGQTQKIKRQPCSSFDNGMYEPYESLKGCRIIEHNVAKNYNYKNK